MCDEAVDDSLAASELIPDWFVTSKIIKELFTALYTDENVLDFNEDSGNVVFSCNEMGILPLDINNINGDNTGPHLVGESRGSGPLPFFNTVQIVPSSA